MLGLANSTNYCAYILMRGTVCENGLEGPIFTDVHDMVLSTDLSELLTRLPVSSVCTVTMEMERRESCHIYASSDSCSTVVITTHRSLTHTSKEFTLSWQDLMGNRIEIKRCEKQTG